MTAGDLFALSGFFDPARERRDYSDAEWERFLHGAATDVGNLVGLLDRMVDQGRTVVVIEHDLDVVARADGVIDLGPGAGHHGGRVVFEGPPAALAGCDTSLTGRHLPRRFATS